MPLVSVALPVHRDEGTLTRAAACMLGQTLADLELLIVCNGSDPDTLATAAAIAKGDSRVRVLQLPDANLARALNTALRQAAAPFVARMDADDWCPRQRLASQLAFISDRTAVAAVGCWYDVRASDGSRVFTVRPPLDPGEARWRLLIANVFAHGSMLLRRDAVLEVGGYDSACARAQDYDLWLRLARRWGLCAVPEVLYTYTVRDAGDASRSSREQSGFAAPAILNAWSTLPALKDPTPLAQAMSQAMTTGQNPEAARRAIEAALTSEPTGEALLAWLWSQHVSPPAPSRAAEVSRRARVREVGAMLRRDGVTAVWLWGAGDHTRRLLEHPEDLGMEIVGIVDDAPMMPELCGVRTALPDALHRGDCVVLSSDWHEDAMWASSRACRERGVRVERLYGV